MRLNRYSFDTVELLWFSGGLPFPAMDGQAVRFTFTCPGSPVPHLTGIGTLLCAHRPEGDQTAVTLQLAGSVGHGSPASEPGTVGSTAWDPEPGTDIWRYFGIPLPREAVERIRRVSGHAYEFELSLDGVEFVDVPPPQR